MSGLNDYLQYVLSAVSSKGWFDVLNDKATIAHFTAEKFGALPIPKPAQAEQIAIVRFLDHATDRIDRYIRAKEKLIALLDEYKQALIHDAVTGRVDVRTGKPYVAYKPSGVEWLGEVPEHWKIERAKWLFSKKNRAVRDSDEVVTCFRDGTVTLRRNRRVLGFTESLKEIGYQGIRRGDLVIHAMDAFAGAIGVADSDGKCTPIYSVCTPTSLADPEYYAHAIREMARNQWILALAKGVRERSTDFRFSDFRAQLLPLPSLPEQIAIVRYLDDTITKIIRAVARTDREIELLREYRTRLISDVVTGKLDVREAASALQEKTRPQNTALGEIEGSDANQEEATKMTNWDTCPAVERKPGKVSGAWVFAGTRIPLSALYENLAGGATVDDFVEWFPGVDEQQVRTVLEHEAQTLRSELAR